MFGTNTNMGGDNSCATSLTTACDIRDPFAYTGCNNVEGIAGVRMMYCQTPANAWDEECMDGMHGTVTATRMTACQNVLARARAGIIVCATSLATACDIRDPFAYTGCKDVAGIAEVRVMYCETLTTAWDAECMQTIHGNVTIKRGDACLKFGTDTTKGRASQLR